eukprot:Nitzschia sp. Nitz4//scaffold29_size155292//11068//14277//NITZ4_002634-RA/size155292-processed-gene-0.237-mRNA-1//1//CDS//3329546376//6705//frame0
MEEGVTTPRGDASSEASSSPYFRRRFDGMTRREAMEHLKNKSPATSRVETASEALGPEIPDPTEGSSAMEPSSPPKLVPISMRNKEVLFDQTANGPSNPPATQLFPSENDQTTASPSRRPLHEQASTDELHYYRVVYRGVVSLLVDPSFSSPRSGAYVSYGEIIASSAELLAEPPSIPNLPATPIRKGLVMSPDRGGAATTSRKLIRVDKVLTGGYSVDALSAPVEACDQTPKRDNTHTNVSIFGPSPIPLCDAPASEKTHRPHGYIFLYRNDAPTLVRIIKPPKCEQGSFLYRVVASSPLPIFTGPCDDAPKTKGMLVPGTVHEVCLRIIQSSVCYLRLSRRRGWVADRMPGSKVQAFSDVLVMKDVTDETGAIETNTSTVSVAGSTIMAPVSTVQKRHRPPRRRRDVRKENDASKIPNDVGAGTFHGSSQPAVENHQNTSHERNIMSPSSNVSILSDESSLDRSMARHSTVLTPDRSVSRSTVSSHAPSHPSFFLMRVNAPRGLKILDAPHFQVNNLIRGTHVPGSSFVASPTKDSQGSNQSIFQTMSGHHSTTLTSKNGNPAVFDSNTKARRLPRGSVFEASKRMEASGAFNQGAGLIKLSDNSGWAIVPKQEELSQQYRSYSGTMVGTKEGEASRAFDEVGNAIVDESLSPVYIRVLTRGVSEDETSPTSSAGGSSALSATTGSIVGRPTDSDVASSVGSSFLDAVFRTPRKKDTDSQVGAIEMKRENTQHPPPAKNTPAERVPFSAVIPCGSVVETERWIAGGEPDKEPNPRSTEFARIRGGQGWIPRYVNGKPVAEVVDPPEIRFGSFWFRVRDPNGIKVRLGPSSRAPSIKSDDGVYFRFECGEFLRASEVTTFFRNGAPSECYAKLYRNRHVRLYTGHGGVRPLTSWTLQAEWVEVFSSQDLYLEECGAEPRIERHKQGWRYNVVLDARVLVRKGSSFDASTTGVALLGGESVLVTERVTGTDDTTTWLRLRDGRGWVHTVGQGGETLMIPHSLRHRKGPPGRPVKPGREGHEDIAYNTIIARLFNNEQQDESNPAGSTISDQHRSRWR